MRQVDMLDLRSEYDLFADEIRAVADEVLTSQHFIGGPAIAELEEAIGARCAGAHAIAVSCGTDALLCALMALEIGQGDEVILPSFTFFATAGSVHRVGAKPVFVDIDPRTFNLDPAKIEPAITENTKAIMMVHLYGQCAEMKAINAIARRYGLKVIEDAAQAIGATYHGRPACALGNVACLSFYPTKNLGGFGEGGMVLTGDAGLATIIRQLRNHGESARYIHERVGGNFRFDTMKAGFLLVKLRHLDEFTKRRRMNAARYDTLLADAPVTTPYRPDHQGHVYHQYSILCDHRDELAAFLKDKGIGTAIYYPVPLHLQKCFAHLGCRPGALPITEEICGKILSIPCHPMLTDDDVQYVSAYIHEFYGVSPGGQASDSGRAVETAGTGRGTT